ncbi:MAG: hypothetical protein LUJ09_09085 [Firmicutes bacterium]|nr:hypothetical protein [Bacillota bacterium]
MKKIISLFLAVCTLAMVLTGCGGTDSTSVVQEAPSAICYVIGNHANSQAINYNSPLVQDNVYECILNYGFISVVEVDGSPDVIAADSYDIDAKYKGASEEHLKRDAQSKATNLINAMSGVIAHDAEADYLEALNLAVRSLASLDGYASKTIVVLGTGLSTSGLMNFQNNLFAAEPEAIAELLAEMDAVPDFTGITVVWQQLGDVAAPQSMTHSQKVKLQEIWAAVVQRGGGDFICNDIMPLAVDTSLTYPEVSVVELPKETPISFESAITQANEEGSEQSSSAFDTPIILSEEEVEFYPDSANYLEPQAALETLLPIAEYLLSDGNTTELVLAGTIAGDSCGDSGMELSLRRAEAVRDSLVSLGVPAERLVCVGCGCYDPWHISGVGTSSALAQQNRKVVLMDAASQTAADILAEFTQ